MPRYFVIFQLGSDPYKGEKKIVQIMGFMVFKSTGLDSRFQRKNCFWKICTESRDIGQNVSNFAGLVWKPDFLHFSGNILGLDAYFLNWFLCWNHDSKPVDLNTMNPIIRTTSFSQNHDIQHYIEHMIELSIYIFAIDIQK